MPLTAELLTPVQREVLALVTERWEATTTRTHDPYRWAGLGQLADQLADRYPLADVDMAIRGLHRGGLLTTTGGRDRVYAVTGTGRRIAEELEAARR